jgi:hypothetical protein
VEALEAQKARRRRVAFTRPLALAKTGGAYRRRLAVSFRGLEERVLAKVESSGLLGELHRAAQERLAGRNGAKADARGVGGRPYGDDRAREIERLFRQDDIVLFGELIGSDIDDWEAEFELIAGEEAKKAYVLGGRAGQAQLKIRPNFNLRAPGILEALEERANLLAGPVAESVFDRMISIVAEEFFLEGKGPLDVARTLRGEFDFLSRHRSEAIARTETLAVTEDAQFTLYAASGVPLKRWGATLSDDRTRFAHINAHGQVRAIDEPFELEREDGTKYELMHPGDEDGPADGVIFCRCFHQPIVAAEQLLEPAAIWDGATDPEEFAELRTGTKHLGPGTHPGTGTPQIVHGLGGEAAARLEDAGRRINSYTKDFSIDHIDELFSSGIAKQRVGAFQKTHRKFQTSWIKASTDEMGLAGKVLAGTATPEDAARLGTALGVDPEKAAQYVATRYLVTQKLIKQPELRVFRGVHGQQAKEIADQLAAGAQTVTVSVRSLTSFSSDRKVARDFALHAGTPVNPRQEHAVLLSIKTPKERVFAHHKAEPKLSRAGEDEVVLWDDDGMIEFSAADVEVLSGGKRAGRRGPPVFIDDGENDSWLQKWYVSTQKAPRMPAKEEAAVDELEEDDPEPASDRPSARPAARLPRANPDVVLDSGTLNGDWLNQVRRELEPGETIADDSEKRAKLRHRLGLCPHAPCLKRGCPCKEPPGRPGPCPCDGAAQPKPAKPRKPREAPVPGAITQRASPLAGSASAAVEAEKAKIRQRLAGEPDADVDTLMGEVGTSDLAFTHQMFGAKWRDRVTDELGLSGKVLAGTATAEEKIRWAEKFPGGAKGAEEYLRTQYAATQETLAKQGVEEVVAYRGICCEQAEQIRTALETGQPIRLATRSVSSFASKKAVATKFISGRGVRTESAVKGLVIRVRIPRERVFAHHATQPRLSNRGEDELILLNPEESLEIRPEDVVVKRAPRFER